MVRGATALKQAVHRRWQQLDAVVAPRTPTFTSPLHNERTAALLGTALGASFGVCFLTGLLSHLIQQPPSWFFFPAHPAGLYRLTQGIHVATGIASVPLLLAKLWTVYPHFVGWPPVRDVSHAIERLSLLPLVGGALFQLFSGVANVARWYPYPFFFTTTHYWTAWITIGALIVHIGAKFTITRQALFYGDELSASANERQVVSGGLTRRGFIATVASASALLTLVTVGQTLRPLARFGLLSPRRPNFGPQGFPVNKSAMGAGVIAAASSPDYRLRIRGKVAIVVELDLKQLQEMPQTEVDLPITCVEGWSANARWSGVRLRDVIAKAGVTGHREVIVSSIQTGGAYRQSVVDASHTRADDTLLALMVNGAPLALDHGYPVRLIAPNRPGVMQTKWVNELEVR